MSNLNNEMEEICKAVAKLTVPTYKEWEELKKACEHIDRVKNHEITKQSQHIVCYLNNLNKRMMKTFVELNQVRDSVEVEYIFTTEKKSSVQRQRFNSLLVSEVPELLKTEFLISEKATQIHICTDCDVEIEISEEEPLMESLQKHFSIAAHLPKMKRESVDVSEPILLPKMSRRLSAMECGENSGQNIEQLMQMLRPVEKTDRMFMGKLKTALIRHLPDNSEASIDAGIKFYQQAYSKLCQEISSIDFTTLTSSVAPLIMSIKDNVNQNFAVDTNKNFENDDAEPAPERPTKNIIKKYRYYGPIENMIVKLLKNHKLLTLVDDRTGKLAFFCMTCEYYTLRFRYDSVLNHVLSETHVHNLSCILQADKHITSDLGDASVEKIKDINYKFLFHNGVMNDAQGLYCGLCKSPLENETIIMHILDENHLARLSDKLYRKMKTNNQDGPVPDEWGPKSLDWAKFIVSTGKPLNNRDHVVIENFIKTANKLSNYCSCCDMTLKGPRQVLFNHIRQKKHLRNAAPHKLALLYKNHCRPAEYFASFGNFYVCAICPSYIALPSFGAIVEHFESIQHVDIVAKLIRSALYPEYDEALLEWNRIVVSDEVKCELCDESFADVNECIKHILTDVEHQTSLVDSVSKAHKGDVISVYMCGDYVLHSEGATFSCVPCNSVFNSIRSLLTHLVYADHFADRPSAENIFRFYLVLKHNINLLSRNKYVYYEFGKLRCGVCEADVEDGENAKRHVVSPRHRENIGTSYVNVSLDVTAVE